MSEVTKIFKVQDVAIEGDLDDESAPLIFTITTDAVDRDQDIVVPEGIVVENYVNNPVMQWAHQYDELPVGKSVEMWAQPIKTIKDGEEVIQQGIKSAVVFQPDSNYHESYSGLRGQMVRRMYLTGFLNAVSIGFDPLEWEEIEEKSNSFNIPKKYLKWEMLEFSAVPVPANPQALIDRAKQFGLEKSVIKAMLKSWTPEAIKYCTGEDCARKLSAKSVIPYKQTPKAPDDEAWDGPAEIAAATPDVLKIICTWYDSENPEAKSSYKLPHHKAAGTHSVVRAGVVGAGNAIQGARGGVNIPASDVPGVKSHLQKHYHEFDMKAPWEEKGEDMIIEKAGRVLSAKNESDLVKAAELINGVVRQVQSEEEATEEEQPKMYSMIFSYPLGQNVGAYYTNWSNTTASTGSVAITSDASTKEESINVIPAEEVAEVAAEAAAEAAAIEEHQASGILEEGSPDDVFIIDTDMLADELVSHLNNEDVSQEGTQSDRQGETSDTEVVE